MIEHSRLFKELVRIEVLERFPGMLRGRPRILTFDDAYDGIMRVLRTGMQWRELSTPSSSYITVFKTMHKWIKGGVFRTAYGRLLKLYRRTRTPKHYCIDSSFVKNVYGIDCTGRNPTDRGRRATKLSVLVDDLGVPVSLVTSPGNVSDMRLFTPVMDSAMTPLQSGAEVFADKGYDSRANREDCRRRGMRDRIFRRRSVNGQRTHAKRGVVERFFAWHDKYRRLLVRYEKKVLVYENLTLIAIGTLLERRMEPPSD